MKMNRSCFSNRNGLHPTFLCCLLLTSKVALFFPPCFLALVSFCGIDMRVFFFLYACNSFLFGNYAYIFTSPRGSPELPHL